MRTSTRFLLQPDRDVVLRVLGNLTDGVGAQTQDKPRTRLSDSDERHDGDDRIRVLADYLPIVILALALAFGVLSMVVSRLFRPHHPTPVKLSAYECGIEPERLPEGERFSVKFYLVAMLFIIFDVETIFLFVRAISLRALGIFGLLTMAVFIALLFVVEAYVWMKGGFERSVRRAGRSRPATPGSGSRPTIGTIRMSGGGRPCRLSASRASSWERRASRPTPRSRRRSGAACC